MSRKGRAQLKRPRRAPAGARRAATDVVHLGSDSKGEFGVVNPPVFHASTITFATVAEYEAASADRFGGMIYGRVGTPTTWALEDAIAGLEGAQGATLAPSGLSAIAIAILSQLKAGDHLLVADTVYHPTRHFCTEVLPRYGIAAEYYDPLIGAGIAALLRPNTRAVYVESPGSQTFEMQDVPAIAAAAHAHGARVILDNTWATPLFFKSFAHGVDLSVHAGTKYIVGHSDAMLGVVLSSAACHEAVRAYANEHGLCAAPDDAYLALRGLRTLAVRMQRHQENALAVARWLQDRPEVARVLYPALPGDPGHALWQRDFTGASGLMSIVLKPVRKAAADALIDGLQLFAIGASWGGFESLVLPFSPAKLRTAKPWTEPGPCVRFHIGLEDVADLIDDLAAAFERLRKAA